MIFNHAGFDEPVMYHSVYKNIIYSNYWSSIVYFNFSII